MQRWGEDNCGNTLQELFLKLYAYIKRFVTPAINALIDADKDNVKVTGDQTINGVKTFIESPIVPTPNDTDYNAAADVAFVLAHSGTGGDVTKEYVDTQDELYFEQSKEYTDEKIAAIPPPDVDKAYVDQKDAETLASANEYTDNKISEIPETTLNTLTMDGFETAIAQGYPNRQPVDSDTALVGFAKIWRALSVLDNFALASKSGNVISVVSKKQGQGYVGDYVVLFYAPTDYDPLDIYYIDGLTVTIRYGGLQDPQNLWQEGDPVAIWIKHDGTFTYGYFVSGNIPLNIVGQTSGGTGDVTQAGDNTFTGNNAFNSNTVFGSPLAVNRLISIAPFQVTATGLHNYQGANITFANPTANQHPVTRVWGNANYTGFGIQNQATGVVSSSSSKCDVSIAPGSLLQTKPGFISISGTIACSVTGAAVAEETTITVTSILPSDYAGSTNQVNGFVSAQYNASQTLNTDTIPAIFYYNSATNTLTITTTVRMSLTTMQLSALNYQGIIFT